LPGRGGAYDVGTGGAPQASGSIPYRGEIGVTGDAITLGYIFPRSGAYGALTRNFETAILAAMSEINAAGGVNGRRLNLKMGDDGYNDAALALQSAKALGPQVFGWQTAALLAGMTIAPYADAHGIPMIAAGISRAAGSKLRHVFPITTYGENAAGMFPAFIEHRLRLAGKPVGLLYQATQGVEDQRRAFLDEAARRGMDVVVQQSIEEVPTQCVNEAQKLASARPRPEVVMLIAGALPTLCVLRDAAAIGFHPVWTGLGFEFNAANTGGFTEGIESAWSFRTLDSPAGRRFAAALRAYAPNSDAYDDDLAFIAWSSVFVWAEGLRRAGHDLTREGFVQAMESIHGWDGGTFAPAAYAPEDVSGPSTTIVVKAVHGRWVTVDPVWRSGY
jgi:ABC-type branched-subunit amino acid transport system substrate-binding protein